MAKKKPPKRPLAMKSDSSRGVLAAAGTTDWVGFGLAAFASLIGFLLLRLAGDMGSSTADLVAASARGLVVGCMLGLVWQPWQPTWLPAAGAGFVATLGVSIVATTFQESTQPAVWLVVPAVAAAVAYAFALLARAGAIRWAQWIALSLVVMVALWYVGVLGGTPQRAASARVQALGVAPVAERYSFDGEDFLRTYYLMKQGEGYYSAFEQGVIGDTRHAPGYMQSPFNYREPLVFEVWRYLPGETGGALWQWFVAYSIVLIVLAYLLAVQLVAPGIALMAPVGMITFLFPFWWTDSWFTVTEIWAAGFALAALACLLRKWWIPSLILLTLAVASREFMVCLIPAWLLAWWFVRERRAVWWVPVSAVLGPAAALGAHLILVPGTPGGARALSYWLKGGPDRLLGALQFLWSTVSWVVKPLTLLIPVSALLGGLLARPRWKQTATTAAVAVPLLFLGVVSHGRWADYWGAFFIPIGIALAPAILGRLYPPLAAVE